MSRRAVELALRWQCERGGEVVGLASQERVQQRPQPEDRVQQRLSDQSFVPQMTEQMEEVPKMVSQHVVQQRLVIPERVSARICWLSEVIEVSGTSSQDRSLQRTVEQNLDVWVEHEPA